MAALVWFRRDLRLADNSALYDAYRQHQRVYAVYIDCPGQWRLHQLGARQLTFIDQHVMALKQHLAQLGVRLTRLHAHRFAQVPLLLAKWVQQHRVEALYFNDEVGVNECTRDDAVQARLGVPVHRYPIDCVVQPGQLLTKQGTMYQVFTPFRRAWLSYVQRHGYQVLPALRRRCPAVSGDHSAKNTGIDRSWPVGEVAARRRLRYFCQHGLRDYGKQRNFPSIRGTSRLSPYLAIGVLSPQQCLAAIETELGHLPLSDGERGFSWLNEWVWREFYRHLMVAYPRLSKGKAFKEATEQLKWNVDDRQFSGWCEGRTGYPIVDAAMRCLNETGWMHNRLRMIVASFLTKDLRIDWRRGEAYFMNQLIDADFASNNGGWQWSASTGADAAPYFRILNPMTQGKRFDPQGHFVKCWLPELKAVPADAIHAPHAWLAKYDCQADYPPMVVDHAAARQQAIAMFTRNES